MNDPGERARVLAIAADTGYVLCGPRRRVHRHARPLEPVNEQEDAVVHELLDEGLLEPGNSVHVQHHDKRARPGEYGTHVLLTRLGSQLVRQPVEVTYQGTRHRIYRRDEEPHGLGGSSEFWPGRGVIGNEPKWLGATFSARRYWYAVVNPTGAPYRARETVEGLPSRRAALAWLFTHTSSPDNP